MKEKKKGKFIIRILLVMFVMYSVYNIITLRFNINTKKDEIEVLDEKIYSITLQNQELEATLKSDLTEDEIAEIARDKLGLTLPGERIFVDITGK